MKKILFICSVVLMCNAVLARPDHGQNQGQNRARSAGAVYTMDNAMAGNNVLMMERMPHGGLGAPMAYPTGGTGTGDGLGNQGSVLLSPGGDWLFVCNAGSDEVSVFMVTDQGLMLSHKVDSQGDRPISLTMHRNLLYVLNAGGAEGGADNVAGFVFWCGQLVPLPNSVQPLSMANTAPAQVGFTSSGNHLVVTEKATATMNVFSLDDCGLVESVQMFLSPNPPPFGFASGKQNRIYVTEANGGGGNPGASTVSSYLVTDVGALQTISASVATHQTAACWLVLSPNERFAYTANTPDDSISSLAVGKDGQLKLLLAEAAMTGAGSGPVDMAFSRDGRFLYSLNASNGTIGAFRQNHGNGSLQPITGATGLPVGCNGLAAR